MSKEELYNIVFDTPELKEYVENKDKEIERLNNIINEATNFLKNIGYDEEMGRIWNDMNDDECTELLDILNKGE